MSHTDSQRKIQEFFRTGGLTRRSPVTGSSTSPVEDLHLESLRDDESSPERDEAESQPESETQSETDELTNSYDTATSTTATSSSCVSETCECQCCCCNVSTPHHPLIVDSSKKKQLYSSKQHGKQKSHCRTIQSGWYKAHPRISCVHQNIKCIVQPVEQLLSKVC